ncbi:MAG: hypothetical protein HP497_02005 [Nitrospira sp.]|nr:hypothetical protein [Nitrospira sp.]
MLRARAGRVATQDARAWRLLAFSIGGCRFAAKADELAGVSGWREPIALASRTPFVSGVVRLGQTVLPIWDLAARLGLSPRGSERLWLQAKHTLGTMAICIDDEIPVIETVERIAIRPYYGRDVPAHGSFSSGTVEIPILAPSLLGSAYSQ